MREGRTIRLLIVEDNVADVRLVREALQEACRLPVDITAALDGQEALSILKTDTKFDVILLDLNMPKVGGYEVLERSGQRHAPIVVFTSSWNEKDSKRALALGARELIRKPSTYDEYVEAVCGIVERWGRPDNSEVIEAP